MSRVAFLLILGLSLVSALYAQHRGSGNTGTRNTTSGNRSQIRDQDRPRDLTRDQDRLRDRDLQRDQQRQTFHSSDLQKQQYKNANRSASQTLGTVRRMQKSAQQNNFRPDEAREEHRRLQQQVRDMQQAHERLTEGMTSEQAVAVRAHNQEINRLQESMKTRLQSMDDELRQPTPNRARVAEQASAMENEMVQWQKQQQNVASTLTLKD